MRAFVVVVPDDEREIAVDHLFTLGVAAVEERVGGTSGLVELWTEVGDETASTDAAAESLRPGWAWRVVDVDESVAGSWRTFATPTWVTDGVVIVPSWQADYVDTGTALAIRIDPGAAFGMGDHPTTQLTLRALIELLADCEQPADVLDVGCGSGVLAVAAALMGAQRVIAIDISTAAVEATLANAFTNGVAQTVEASTTPLAEIADTFDTVVANVLAPTLIDLAADLTRVVSPGGALVVSGVLVDRHQHVLDALAPLVPTGILTMDGWAAVTLSAAK